MALAYRIVRALPLALQKVPLTCRVLTGTGRMMASAASPAGQAPADTQPQFKDHFSKHSAIYAQSRPTYPLALFQYLASLTPQHECAWDVGTGNGQAALPLSQLYKRVVATDASKEQLQQATPRDNITYKVSVAERMDDAADGSVDLVTVAQAVHWFDLDAFYAEAKRVLRPQHGVLAVWTYQLPYVSTAVDERLHHFYYKVIWDYWPPERKLVDNGYSDLYFPFRDVDPDQPVKEFTSELSWSLPDYLGYLRSWSATQRYIKQHGNDPVTDMEAEFQAAWGDPNERKAVRYPVYMRVGRV